MASKARRGQAHRRPRRQLKQIVGWLAAIGVLGALVYGISLTSGFPYTDRELGVVDFSRLNQQEKREALQAANGTRCSCGCGMTLAQCVATDSTCPLREGNIDRIRTMVETARKVKS